MAPSLEGTRAPCVTAIATRAYGAALYVVERQCRAREARASPQAHCVRCSPIDGGHARSSCDCHSNAGVRWRHGWSTASLGWHGKIKRARWYGATLYIIARQCRAREACASPHAHCVRCSPIDGGHARSSRDWHSSAGVRCRHGWCTASVGRHGKIKRARWYGATLYIIARQCRAREACASPHAHCVRCSPIDGGHARSSRDCHSNVGVRWRHGWSTASVGQHGKIEHARRGGATLYAVMRQRRAQDASASPQAHCVRCSPIDECHARSSRDWHSSAGVHCRHGWCTARVGRHGNIPYARRDGTELCAVGHRC